MDSYRDLLQQIRSHLAHYSVPLWPTRLDDWLRELDRVDPEQLRAHLLRTRKALGGMGSIADVVICPQAGHDIPNDMPTIKAANDKLLKLVDELDREVTRELSGLT